MECNYKNSDQPTLFYTVLRTFKNKAQAIPPLFIKKIFNRKRIVFFRLL